MLSGIGFMLARKFMLAGKVHVVQGGAEILVARIICELNHLGEIRQPMRASP